MEFLILDFEGHSTIHTGYLSTDCSFHIRKKSHPLMNRTEFLFYKLFYFNIFRYKVDKIEEFNSHTKITVSVKYHQEPKSKQKIRSRNKFQSRKN